MRAGSSLAELEKAGALAINFGSPDSFGESEINNFHTILAVFNRINQAVNNCLRLRVLRIQIETSNQLRIGTVVDSTRQDQNYLAQREGISIAESPPSNHWYKDYGLSPPILVIEPRCLEMKVDASSAVLMPRIPVAIALKIKEGISRQPNELQKNWDIFLQNLLRRQPSLALRELYLPQEEIIRLMREAGTLTNNLAAWGF